jgi:hypothetical protein
LAAARSLSGQQSKSLWLAGKISKPQPFGPTQSWQISNRNDQRPLRQFKPMRAAIPLTKAHSRAQVTFHVKHFWNYSKEESSHN